MKTGLAITAAFSTLLAPAVASSKYSAVCVYDELSCGGTIQLREYTPTTNGVCSSNGCDPDPVYQGLPFATYTTCTDDIVKDTEKHLRGRSYVIVEFYDADGCAGEFSNAVAVAANDKCYPASSGEKSYRVSSSSGNATWLEFAGPNCTSNATSTTSFTLESANGATCLAGNIKAVASIEGAATPSPTNGTATPSPSSGAVGASKPLLATAIAAISTGFMCAVRGDLI